MSEDNQVPEKPHYTPQSLLDLRLMHHYSVFTSKAFSGTFDENIVKALQVDLPRLALEHNFLMDAVLFTAMVHLGCNGAPVESMPLFVYRDQALRTLRQAVENVSDSNVHAVRGASVLLAAVSFPTDRITNQSGLWMSNWLTLALGQRNFRALPVVERLTPRESGFISTTGLYGSFSDLFGPAVIPYTIQRALEENPRTKDSQYYSTLSAAAESLGRLIFILRAPFEPTFLDKKVKAWTFDVVHPDFLSLIQQKWPEALVVLAHYLALFKFLPDTWIYEDFATHDIAVVTSILSPAWKRHVSLPRRVIEMNDKTAAARLLVSCIGDNIGSV